MQTVNKRLSLPTKITTEKHNAESAAGSLDGYDKEQIECKYDNANLGV